MKFFKQNNMGLVRDLLGIANAAVKLVQAIIKLVNMASNYSFKDHRIETPLES
jgi:hypothetical protein